MTTPTTTAWHRSRSGIYTSSCGRWRACCVGKRNEWQLTDSLKGRKRYYHSLAAAKQGAETHAKD